MVVPCHLPIPTTTGQFEEYNREIGLAEFVVVEQMKDRWDKPEWHEVKLEGLVLLDFLGFLSEDISRGDV